MPSPNTGPERTSVRAFTLVELLVVMGIIAVLLAILLPVLSKARQGANRVACASNLRQIGLAVMMYATENDRCFPSAGDYAETYNRWGGKQGTHFALLWTNRLINRYVSRGGLTSQNDTGVIEVFRCPSDTGAAAGDYPEDRFPTLYDFWGTSYLYNSSANDNDPVRGLQGKRLFQIRSPATVIVANDWTFSVHFRNFANFSRGLFWHNPSEKGWGNVLFVDGHVDYQRASQNEPDYQNGPDWTFVFNGPIRNGRYTP